MTRPAPYEAVKVARMWGVFHGEGRPVLAMFIGEHAANVWMNWQMRLNRRDPMRIAVGERDEYAVVAVDGITGWAWNDIDPPAVGL